jgi:hypothetical protein
VEEQERSEKQGKRLNFREDEQEEVEGQGLRHPREDEEAEEADETPSEKGASEEGDDVEGHGRWRI